MVYSLTTPISKEDIKKLHIGDIVLISGTIYTARDAAHKRLVELIKEGKELPLDLKDAIIYYVGPTPAKPNQAIGSAGPTSSYRMDAYLEEIMKQGSLISIGKGPRDSFVKDLIKEHGGLYLSTIGGAAASIGKSVTKRDLVAYPDLGAEAIQKLEVKDFYAIVTYDSHGGDLFESGINDYLNSKK